MKSQFTLALIAGIFSLGNAVMGSEAPATPKTPPAAAKADITAVPPPAGWFTNLEEAAAKAQKENKKVLLLLTGSDWCGFCKRLRSQWIDSDDGKKLVQDNFIGVYIDMPSRGGFTPEQKMYNREINRKYNSEHGFPCTVILEPNLTVIGAISGFNPSRFTDTLRKSLLPRPELLVAVAANDTEKAKKLLKDGADATVRDAFDNDALSIAIKNRADAMVTALLENGCKLQPATRKSQSTFVKAILGGASGEVIKKMLAHGAAVNAPEWEAHTYPLQLITAERRDLEIVKILVEAGADCQAVDGYGFSPLHAAAMSNRPEIVKYFLEKGLNPRLKALNGKTPAEMARSAKVRELFSNAPKGDK